MDKRNSFVWEVINLATEAFAALAWFGYFFTQELSNLLGQYDIYAAIGVGVLALFVNIMYARQLGIRHRIVSFITDIFEIGAVVGVATLFYGPLSHQEVIASRSINFDQVVESLKMAAAQPEAISIVVFLGIQLLILLIAHKK